MVNLMPPVNVDPMIHDNSPTLQFGVLNPRHFIFHHITQRSQNPVSWLPPSFGKVTSFIRWIHQYEAHIITLFSAVSEVLNLTTFLLPIVSTQPSPLGPRVGVLNTARQERVTLYILPKFSTMFCCVYPWQVSSALMNQGQITLWH